MTKRFLLILMLSLWLSSPAKADEMDLRGQVRQEAPAPCVVTYTFPQFDEHTEIDEALNLFYQNLAAELPKAYLRMLEESANTDMPTDTTIHYQLMCNDDRYVSVLLTTEQVQTGTVVISANTFARDGCYAGEELILSQILGLEELGDVFTDAHSQAEKLAYQAIWDIILLDQQNFENDYLDHLTIEKLYSVLSPENDFYLDQNGNIVFYIQSGLIASNMAGILTFPFLPAELLSMIATGTAE